MKRKPQRMSSVPSAQPNRLIIQTLDNVPGSETAHIIQSLSVISMSASARIGSQTRQIESADALAA